MGRVTEQRDEAWLKLATPEQIVSAQVAGELSNLLGQKLNELGNSAADLRGVGR